MSRTKLGVKDIGLITEDDLHGVADDICTTVFERIQNPDEPETIFLETEL
jgi:hypothetical protein